MIKLSRSGWIVGAGIAAALIAVVTCVGFAAASQSMQTKTSVAVDARPDSPGPIPGARQPAPTFAATKILTLTTQYNGRDACSPEGQWCVALTEPDDEGLRRPVVLSPAKLKHVSAPAEDASADESWTVWPRLIVLPDGDFLAGVETRMSTSYSGGGGSATQWRLFRVSSTGEAAGTALINLPIQGSLLIRACFTKADVADRAEACHDEYGFTGDVRFEPATSGPPALVYTTQAWAFPRGASREEDSTARGPLTPADLVRERDKTCSFSRRFAFDDRAGIYQAERRLPDCSAYTVP